MTLCSEGPILFSFFSGLLLSRFQGFEVLCVKKVELGGTGGKKW